MGALGWGSDGGGRMQAVGDDSLSARRQHAVAGGGGLAGGSPAHAKTALPGTKQNGKGTKIKIGARGFHRAARRGRRGVGGGDRRRGRSSGSASWCDGAP
jgi:hypothetical protein